jgi:hypothetical protein
LLAKAPNWRHRTLQPPLEQPVSGDELPTDEKVESSLLTSWEPHDGHSVGCAAPFFCNFSKRQPHLTHEYSTIGMVTLLMRNIQIMEYDN